MWGGDDGRGHTQKPYLGGHPFHFTRYSTLPCGGKKTVSTRTCRTTKEPLQHYCRPRLNPETTPGTLTSTGPSHSPPLLQHGRRIRSQTSVEPKTGAHVSEGT